MFAGLHKWLFVMPGDRCRELDLEEASVLIGDARQWTFEYRGRGDTNLRLSRFDSEASSTLVPKTMALGSAAGNGLKPLTSW